MKKLLVFFALIVLQFSGVGQNLNEKGLYVGNDGNLYSGKLTKTQYAITSEYNVINGVIEGAALFFYPNGKLMESGMYASGEKDNKWVRYNENGGISAIAFYKLGKKSGTWLVYDEAGNKRYELNYTDGQKTGIWTSWDASGQVTDTKDYSKLN